MYGIGGCFDWGDPKYWPKDSIVKDWFYWDELEWELQIRELAQKQCLQRDEIACTNKDLDIQCDCKRCGKPVKMRTYTFEVPTVSYQKISGVCRCGCVNYFIGDIHVLNDKKEN